MKPMLLKTPEYMNRVTAKMMLQKVFPTCCASLYIYIYIYSEAQQVGNTFCNIIFAVTLFMYSGVLSSMGFIPTLSTAFQTSLPARGRNFFSATFVPQALHSVSIALASRLLYMQEAGVQCKPVYNSFIGIHESTDEAQGLLSHLVT